MRSRIEALAELVGEGKPDNSRLRSLPNVPPVIDRLTELVNQNNLVSLKKELASALREHAQDPESAGFFKNWLTKPLKEASPEAFAVFDEVLPDGFMAYTMPRVAQKLAPHISKELRKKYKVKGWEHDRDDESVSVPLITPNFGPNKHAEAFKDFGGYDADTVFAGIKRVVGDDVVVYPGNFDTHVFDQSKRTFAPILVDGNHWVLAVVWFEGDVKKYIYIDSEGGDVRADVQLDGERVLVSRHIQQKDARTCGPRVVLNAATISACLNAERDVEVLNAKLASGHSVAEIWQTIASDKEAAAAAMAIAHTAREVADAHKATDHAIQLVDHVRSAATEAATLEVGQLQGQITELRGHAARVDHEAAALRQQIEQTAEDTARTAQEARGELARTQAAVVQVTGERDASRREVAANHAERALHGQLTEIQIAEMRDRGVIALDQSEAFMRIDFDLSMHELRERLESNINRARRARENDEISYGYMLDELQEKHDRLKIMIAEEKSRSGAVAQLVSTLARTRNSAAAAIAAAAFATLEGSEVQGRSQIEATASSAREAMQAQAQADVEAIAARNAALAIVAAAFATLEGSEVQDRSHIEATALSALEVIQQAGAEVIAARRDAAATRIAAAQRAALLALASAEAGDRSAVEIAAFAATEMHLVTAEASARHEIALQAFTGLFEIRSILGDKALALLKRGAKLQGNVGKVMRAMLFGRDLSVAPEDAARAVQDDPYARGGSPEPRTPLRTVLMRDADQSPMLASRNLFSTTPARTPSPTQAYGKIEAAVKLLQAMQTDLINMDAIDAGLKGRAERLEIHVVESMRSVHLASAPSAYMRAVDEIFVLKLSAAKREYQVLMDGTGVTCLEICASPNRRAEFVIAHCEQAVAVAKEALREVHMTTVKHALGTHELARPVLMAEEVATSLRKIHLDIEGHKTAVLSRERQTERELFTKWILDVSPTPLLDYPAAYSVMIGSFNGVGELEQLLKDVRGLRSGLTTKSESSANVERRNEALSTLNRLATQYREFLAGLQQVVLHPDHRTDSHAMLWHSKPYQFHRQDPIERYSVPSLLQLATYAARYATQPEYVYLVTTALRRVSDMRGYGSSSIPAEAQLKENVELLKKAVESTAQGKEPTDLAALLISLVGKVENALTELPDPESVHLPVSPPPSESVSSTTRLHLTSPAPRSTISTVHLGLELARAADALPPRSPSPATRLRPGSGGASRVKPVPYACFVCEVGRAASTLPSGYGAGSANPASPPPRIQKSQTPVGSPLGTRDVNAGTMVGYGHKPDPSTADQLYSARTTVEAWPSIKHCLTDIVGYWVPDIKFAANDMSEKLGLGSVAVKIAAHLAINVKLADQVGATHAQALTHTGVYALFSTVKEVGAHLDPVRYALASGVASIASGLAIGAPLVATLPFAGSTAAIAGLIAYAHKDGLAPQSALVTAVDVAVFGAVTFATGNVVAGAVAAAAMDQTLRSNAIADGLDAMCDGLQEIFVQLAGQIGF